MPKKQKTPKTTTNSIDLKKLSDIEHIALDHLSVPETNARIHPRQQIDKTARFIKTNRFIPPLLVSEEAEILAGAHFYFAAVKLGLETIPVVRVEGLSAVQRKAVRLALARLVEDESWDKDKLQQEFAAIFEVESEFDLTETAFDMAEIDIILGHEPVVPETVDEKLDRLLEPKVPRAKAGDLFVCGEHRILCGDSTDAASYKRLLGDEVVRLVATDFPYNLKIDGVATGKGKIKHEEFEQASGEMTPDEFLIFLKTVMESFAAYLAPGGLFYGFMDWRQIAILIAAGQAVFETYLGLIVWDKLRAGMGGLYRNRHELIALFKKGCAQHVNNVQLGKYGRNRSNIWSYPGIMTVTEAGREMLELHPTVKPVSLMVDLLLDASNVGDIVLDPFGGSGTTLLAAEKAKRNARLIEINPHYVDITLARFEAMTGEKAELIKGEAS